MHQTIHPTIRDLLPRIAPFRYGSKLRFPGLVWQVLRHRRRDRRQLQQEVSALIAAEGRTLDPQVLGQYLESMILLHYLQRAGVRVYSMMKPELMESLAVECTRVIEAGVSGALVDVGVWKGGSAMIMKAVNDLLGAARPVQLLDIYDTMDHKVLDASDPVEDRIIVTALEHARRHFGTEGVATSIAEIRDNFGRLGLSLDGVEFLEGNLISPSFPFEAVGDIALLRIDCDFYTATRNTLERLYPKMQPGGTIIFDDYYLEAFGERRAADELRAAVGDDRPLIRVGQSAVWRLPGPAGLEAAS